MKLADSYGETIRIALDDCERVRPYLKLVSEMTEFLVKELGADKAAEYEHVNVSDPGYAHFRKCR